MLVLSRKMDEQIVIGDGICITVLSVKGDRVKLGIRAADDVRIMRGELLGAPADPGREPGEETPHAILDPTAGLSAEDSSDANAPTGTRGSFPGPGRPDVRPAWLAICCCS